VPEGGAGMKNFKVLNPQRLAIGKMRWGRVMGENPVHHLSESEYVLLAERLTQQYWRRMR
jgi:hypothetical protein